MMTFFMIESTGLACQRLICDLVSTGCLKLMAMTPCGTSRLLCPTKVGPTGERRS